MPESEFSEITLQRPAMAFRTEEPSHLPNVAPHMVRVGKDGCVAIRRGGTGGFDVLGVDGQSYWIPDSNVIWGRRK